jgi:A/G-specific adenine glycosylase
MLKSSGRKTDRPRSRQSRFEGSDRQLRGKCIRFLLDRHAASRYELIEHLGGDEGRATRILAGLERDGFITFINGIYTMQTKMSPDTP